MFTYLVSDYSATGEGRTVSVLVTHSYIFDDAVYKDDGLTPPLRKVRLFSETFDAFWAQGMQELTQQEFESRYMWAMPEMVHRIIHDDNPPGFSWSTQIHMNFS